MSIQLGTNAKRTIFSDRVKMAYQSMGPAGFEQCCDYVRQEGVETYNFRQMGRGIATRRGASQSQLTPMGITHGTIACTLTDWVANELTDVFDQAKTNAPQEISKLATVIAGALARRRIQILIDALDTPTYSGDHTIAHGSVGMSTTKILQARRALKADDITELVTMFMTEEQEYDLLIESGNKFTSADFAAESGATTGDVKQGHFGCKYVLIGSGRDEDGLPKASTTRTCFAFVPTSVGYVDGMMKTEVNYESDKLSWRSTGLLWAGAVVEDAGGIVEVFCTETD